MDYLLDTNILLLLMSSPSFEQHFQEHYLLPGNTLAISTVVVGEMKGIALVRHWGEKRLHLMQRRLDSLLVVPIHQRDIHNRYAEIFAYSQGKLPDRPLGYTARNMGQNDLWMAASASVTDATLLTTDKDFDHLHGVYLQRVWVDIQVFS